MSHSTGYSPAGVPAGTLRTSVITASPFLALTALSATPLRAISLADALNSIFSAYTEGATAESRGAFEDVILNCALEMPSVESPLTVIGTFTVEPAVAGTLEAITHSAAPSVTGVPTTIEPFVSLTFDVISLPFSSTIPRYSSITHSTGYSPSANPAGTESVSVATASPFLPTVALPGSPLKATSVLSLLNSILEA